MCLNQKIYINWLSRLKSKLGAAKAQRPLISYINSDKTEVKKSPRLDGVASYIGPNEVRWEVLIIPSSDFTTR
jgi:hypothetical protein